MMANVSRTFLPGIALVALAFAMPATAGTTAPTAPAAFSRCLVCHNAAKGAADKIGPNLWGIFDRKAAHAKFNYSPALKAANLKWDGPTLDKWIAGPTKMVPGTMMSFPGISDPAKRAEIIAYLKKLH